MIEALASKNNPNESLGVVGMLLYIQLAKPSSIEKQGWESYAHVCKPARNVHVKIYKAHKMYMHVKL